MPKKFEYPLSWEILKNTKCKQFKIQFEGSAKFKKIDMDDSKIVFQRLAGNMRTVTLTKTDIVGEIKQCRVWNEARGSNKTIKTKKKAPTTVLGRNERRLAKENRDLTKQLGKKSDECQKWHDQYHLLLQNVTINATIMLDKASQRKVIDKVTDARAFLLMAREYITGQTPTT